MTPKTDIPGTDCALPGTACLTGAALDEAREVVEGELFQPTAPWTATDVYDGGPYYNDGTNSTPSAARSVSWPTAASRWSRRPRSSTRRRPPRSRTRKRVQRRAPDHPGRRVSLTYSTTQNSGSPFPWFTADHTVRVGSAITFPKPVVFTYGFNTWRILPQSQVVGDPTGTINFEQTRPAAPENVGGDVKLATFNVLNFFPTTGEEFVALGVGTCTYFRDRDGNPISNNQCNPNGPRGAANEANLVAPAGQDRRGDQHRRRRHRLASRSSRTPCSSARTVTSRSTSSSRPSTPTPAPAPGRQSRPRPPASCRRSASRTSSATASSTSRARRPGRRVRRAGRPVHRDRGLRRRPRAGRPGLQAGRDARTPTPSPSSSTTSSPRAPARRTPSVRATPTTVASSRPTRS